MQTHDLDHNYSYATFFNAVSLHASPIKAPSLFTNFMQVDFIY